MKLFSLLAFLAVLIVTSATVIPGHPGQSTRSLGRRGNNRDVSCKTNAECLAKGLPLRRPSFKGRRDVEPGTGIIALIQVFDINNSSLGYVSPTYGFFRPDNNREVASIFQITTTATNTELNIGVNDANYPWLSLSYDGGSNEIKPGAVGYAGISRFPTALQPGPPVYEPAPSYGRGTETAVWTYDTVRGGLTASWINTDNSVVPLTFYSIYNNGFMGATADYALNSEHVGGDSQPVTMVVVPIQM